MAYINKEELISDILRHKQNVGQGIDIYQLAHDHIIQIVKLQNVIDDPEDVTILGYRVKDLVVYAERLRLEKKSPYVLKADTDDFLAGYEAAREEINKQLEDSINKMISDLSS